MLKLTDQPPPLITMLFVPAIDEGKLGKISASSSDAFILDLEDSVAETEKGRARSLCSRTLTDQGAQSHLYVRVNNTASRHLMQDLEAIVLPGLAGIQLPKVNSAIDVQIVDWVVSQLEANRSMPVGAVRLLPTIETAAGVSAADAIAAASRRNRTLALGLGDLKLDLALGGSEDLTSNPVATAARVAVVYAARRACLEAPHDSAYAQYNDNDGLRREASFSRVLGFGGKHAIHPAQLALIQEVYSPSDAEVVRARRIVSAFDEAEAQGTAAIGVEGELVDYPIAARAAAILRLGQRDKRER